MAAARRPGRPGMELPPISVDVRDVSRQARPAERRRVARDRVRRHGGQQHAAGDHELHGRVERQQVHPVGDRHDHEARPAARPRPSRDRRTGSRPRRPARRSTSAADRRRPRTG